jgi:hypothetical protein
VKHKPQAADAAVAAAPVIFAGGFFVGHHGACPPPPRHASTAGVAAPPQAPNDSSPTGVNDTVSGHEGHEVPAAVLPAPVPKPADTLVMEHQPRGSLLSPVAPLAKHATADGVPAPSSAPTFSSTTAMHHPTFGSGDSPAPAAGLGPPPAPHLRSPVVPLAAGAPTILPVAASHPVVHPAVGTVSKPVPPQ